MSASLEKTTRIDKSSNSIQINSDKINWVSEFEPFRAISLINKPIYSGNYDVEVNPDQKSNLLIKSWSTRKDIPVRSIKVFYLESPIQIKRLEANLEQTNFVFNSTKNLILDFNLLGNNPTVDRYEISGYQKFFWEDPHYYSLSVNVEAK